MTAPDLRSQEAAVEGFRQAKAIRDANPGMSPLEAIRIAKAVADPKVTATRYEVSCLPQDDINRSYFTIDVEYRGRGLWAVSRYRQCLGSDGEWDFESIPSERKDEWLATHRFDLEAALRLAQEHAPKIVVNRMTVEQALAAGDAR